MAPYVLVVESDPEQQQRIAQILREASYELSTEREAAWARRSLLVRPPDGVIVNTRLTDGPGFLVAEELRKDPDGKNVPVLFIASDHRGPSHAAEARRRFAPAEYLPTPLDLNTLLARMLSVVPPPEQAGGRRPMLTPPPAAPMPEDLVQTVEAQQVERQASTLIPAPAESDAAVSSVAGRATKGTLERQSFARVLSGLYVERRSGSLLVVQDKRKKIVEFDGGYPVSVRSNVVTECLGHILVSRKRITKDALDVSVRRMKAESRQQGEILIEMGVLSPHGLQTALREQIEAKLLDLFSWTAGNWLFTTAPAGPPEAARGAGAARLERSTAALILEGVRRSYSPDRQEQVCNELSGRFVVPTDDVRLRMQDMTVDSNERRFIDSIDGSQMLEMILNVPPIPKDKARSLLAAMIEAGMVEAADEPRVAGGGQPGDSEESTPDDAGGEGWGKPELAAHLEKTRAQTHFEVLGVGANASAQEIESAYVKKARAFHPDGFRSRPDEVRELIDRIFTRLGEARGVLREPTKRTSYIKRLERARSFPGGGPDAVAVAEQVYFTGVEHLRARRYTEAVHTLQTAVQLVPGQSGYHSSLGWALYRRAPTVADAVTLGRQQLEYAVTLDEEDPWLRVSLGRFLSETGDVAGAIVAFEQALALQPDLSEIEPEIRRLKGNA